MISVPIHRPGAVEARELPRLPPERRRLLSTAANEFLDGLLPRGPTYGGHLRDSARARTTADGYLEVADPRRSELGPVGWQYRTPRIVSLVILRCVGTTVASISKTWRPARFDIVIERWEHYPDLHIYHYAPYEPAALRRLMGRYSTHEADVDRMLCAGLFVDLYAVVRRSLRASVERYSIKDLEVFYGYARAVPLREASLHLRTVEWAELVAGGEEIARPELSAGDPSEKVDARRVRVQTLKAELAGEVSVDPAARTDEEHARWLLAEMLEWRWREARSVSAARSALERAAVVCRRCA